MRNALSTVSKLNKNPPHFKMTQQHKAFTLVEVMIVTVIIGLLAAMAIPAYQKVKENGVEQRIHGQSYNQWKAEFQKTSVVSFLR